MESASAPWLHRAAGPLASWLRTAPGFSAEAGPGWWRVGCIGPKPDFNILAVTGEAGAAQESLAQGFESVLRLGRPAIICVAAEMAAAVVELIGVLPVRSAGMLPHYLKRIEDVLPIALPAGETIEIARDASGFHDCMAVLTAAFGDPYNDPDGMFQPELLADPNFTFRLLRREGAAVSTVVTWRSDEYLYVTIMATHPDHQGQGAGSRLLRSTLAEEYGLGARFAHLVSSEIGAKLYRGTGFQLLANHPLWLYDGARELGFRATSAINENRPHGA